MQRNKNVGGAPTADQTSKPANKEEKALSNTRENTLFLESNKKGALDSFISSAGLLRWEAAQLCSGLVCDAIAYTSQWKRATSPFSFASFFAKNLNNSTRPSIREERQSLEPRQYLPNSRINAGKALP